LSAISCFSISKPMMYSDAATRFRLSSEGSRSRLMSSLIGMVSP
jgi:hypothetical protein